ncbi:hypothetical protein RclHR1_17180001 [Rhizophagus clarus]|uniref:Uncharacterized protein n=1 Tax=Rhizophagus clarus TaxID=94130 RepID=A0A2Z6QJK2_9GLOM|nr:hypothetical protein RclHR1_17180001 [Rhizophagus clarus]GES94352.1 hypothetical protein RCL_jg14150.t1 [Rhizophagus clarus]
MKNDIQEYLSAVLTIGPQTVYGLLSKKYPAIYIHQKNLYNAIQEIRRSERLYEKDDTHNMLQELYDLQKENSG